MYYLNCLSFGNIETKKAVVFGSKGWAGGSARILAANLEGAGFEVVEQMELDFNAFTHYTFSHCMSHSLGGMVHGIINEGDLVSFIGTSGPFGVKVNDKAWICEDLTVTWSNHFQDVHQS